MFALLPFVFLFGLMPTVLSLPVPISQRDSAPKYVVAQWVWHFNYSLPRSATENLNVASWLATPIPTLSTTGWMILSLLRVPACMSSIQSIQFNCLIRPTVMLSLLTSVLTPGNKLEWMMPIQLPRSVDRTSRCSSPLTWPSFLVLPHPMLVPFGNTSINMLAIQLNLCTTEKLFSLPSAARPVSLVLAVSVQDGRACLEGPILSLYRHSLWILPNLALWAVSWTALSTWVIPNGSEITREKANFMDFSGIVDGLLTSPRLPFLLPLRVPPKFPLLASKSG